MSTIKFVTTRFHAIRFVEGFYKFDAVVTPLYRTSKFLVKVEVKGPEAELVKETFQAPETWIGTK